MKDTREPMTSLPDSVNAIAEFEGGSLKQRISQLEKALQNASPSDCVALLSERGISPGLLRSCVMVKQAAAQIDVVLHTVGILVSLSRLLHPDETIESLSLGAGNTGRAFDLQTNLRIAEFKFINWRGGSEAIRQNSLFKDFYLLAEANTPKERYLYAIDTDRPLRFLNGRRAIRSILSHENKLWMDFQGRYGDRFSVVCEYFEYRKDLVKIVALSELLPDLWAGPDRPNEEEAC